MRTIVQGSFYRPVAWLSLMALAAGLIAPAAPASAAAGVLPRVAVVQVVDQSGSPVQNLASRALSAVTTKLFETGGFEVIALEETQKAAEAVGLKLPAGDGSDTALLALATELRADFLILAEIDAVQVEAARELATVGASGKVFDRLGQAVITEAEVSAFNVQRTNSEAVLVDDALDEAAFGLVKTLLGQLSMRGRVVARPIEDEVRVNFDQREDLRLGSTLGILRNGLLIAKMELQAAETGYCSGLLTERLRPEMGVSVNDEVVLYRQGTGRLVAADPDVDPNKDSLRDDERGRRNQATLWAIIGGLAAIAVGVWAFTSANDKRDDARTPSLIAPANNSALRVDATNILTTPVDFVATATRGTDTATFQIATDRAFTAIELSQTEISEGATQGGDTEGTDETVSQFVFEAPTTEAFLAPGTYFWRVIAASGRDTYTSNTFTFTVTGPGAGGGGGTSLRSPDTVTALSGDRQVEVQWTPVTGATNYQVYRRVLTPRMEGAARTRTFRPGTGSNAWVRSLSNTRSVRGDRRRVSSARTTRQSAELAGFSLLLEVDATDLSYTDAAVENGVEYQWLVLTKNAAGIVTPLADAQAGSFATSTPLSITAPEAPTNLTAIAGDGQVILSWTQNAETDLAGYQVFRATSANGNFVDVTNNLVTDSGSLAEQGLSAAPGDISVTDSGLTNGVTAFYRIRAVQMQVEGTSGTRGGLTSPLSEAVEATPSSAPPQELQVTQPPNGSTIDADRPQLAWRGVSSASTYTVQISTDPTFGAGVIEASSTETELIYPSTLPDLAEGTTYYMRVGVFDEDLQQMRYGPSSSFTRGTVGRITTTIATTLGGLAFNGARITVDGADTGSLTPSEVILAPKTGNAPYAVEASYTSNEGVRYEGSASYRPGIDAATVTIALALLGTAPVAPTGLTATGETDHIVLRWNPDPNLLASAPQPDTVAEVYSVRRRANTEEGTFTEIAQVTGPTASGSVTELLYSDYNVQTGVRYYYQIVAIGGNSIESLPSVTTNGVAGVAVIDVLTPQDNQSFSAEIIDGGKAWQSQIDYAWNPVDGATRYIFEVGSDPELNNLLENGNELIAASDTPSAAYTLGSEAPEGFIFAGDLVIIELYWRAIAVDAQNRIINQTEARRFFVHTLSLVPEP